MKKLMKLLSKVKCSQSANDPDIIYQDFPYSLTHGSQYFSKFPSRTAEAISSSRFSRRKTTMTGSPSLLTYHPISQYQPCQRKAYAVHSRTLHQLLFAGIDKLTLSWAKKVAMAFSVCAIGVGGVEGQGGFVCLRPGLDYTIVW